MNMHQLITDQLRGISLGMGRLLKNRLLNNRLAITLGVLCLSLVIVSVASACPGCKSAIESNDPLQANIAKGYFWSILFMLSMPFLLCGTFGGYIFIELRRARADQEKLEEPPTP